MLWPLKISLEFAINGTQARKQPNFPFEKSWGNLVKSDLVDIWLRYMQHDHEKAANTIATIRLNQTSYEYSYVKSYPPVLAKQRIFELIAIYSMIEVAASLVEYRRTKSIQQLENTCDALFRDAQFAIYVGGLPSLQRFYKIAHTVTSERINTLKGYRQ